MAQTPRFFTRFASRISLLVACVMAMAPSAASAGGGPANVMVVYVADDPAATMVAMHYQAARSLMPGYLCGLKGIDETKTSIDYATYQMQIQAPLDACLAALPSGQADDVDYLVLVRGLPYLVNLPNYTASLEAVLQVGHAKDAMGNEVGGLGQTTTMGTTAASILNPQFLSAIPQPGDFTIMNQYSEWYVSATGIVRADSQPSSFRRKNAGSNNTIDFDGNLFIVTRLDGFDFTDATALIDRAVASDGTMPTAEILCMESSDGARGARDPECEFTTRMLTSAGFKATFVMPFDGNLSGHTVAAYFTGTASLTDAIAGNTYVPGAITDNLTSYGAVISNFFCDATGMACPLNESQTSIARFVRAGATGAHGTVNEPLNNVFPNAGALLLYTLGYNLGESYFMNQQFLHWQNITLGDPLATPYATRPKIVFPDPATVAEGSPLVITATHAAGIAAMSVYVAGTLVGTSMSGSISYAPAGAAGTSLDVLVTAVSNDAAVMRAGWPQPMQQPSPDVQGWASATITIVPSPPEMATLPDLATEPDAADATKLAGGGCGCELGGNRNSSTGGACLLLFVAMTALRRRKRIA